MENIDALIETWINEHREEMIEELKAWVRIPSVSRADFAKENAPFGEDCRRMLDFALAEGRKYGFRTEDYDGYCGAVIYGDKKDEIGFVCHLDVVPEGDHWIYSPYDPIEKNGFLIGRGVGDNKGPGVLCLFLLRFFKENNIPLHNTLRLMLGCAEETGMADFKHYNEVLHGPIPAVGIVADAGFPACYAQKGGYNGSFEIKAGKNIVSFSGGLVRNAIPDEAVLTINGISVDEVSEHLKDVPNVSVEANGANVRLIGHGKAGHAAFPTPNEKNNAIVNVSEAAVVLSEKTGLDLHGTEFIAKAFTTAFGDGLDIAYTDEESGALTLNVGVIAKNDDLLHMDFDIRYPVTDTSDSITEKLLSAADKAGAKLTDTSISQPYYIDPEDPKVTALLDAYKTVTGDTGAKPYSMGGGTYSRVVPNAITFGPGLSKGAHQQDFLPAGHGGAHGPDEVLNIEDWLTGFRIYLQSVIRLDQVMHDSQS